MERSEIRDRPFHTARPPRVSLTLNPGYDLYDFKRSHEVAMSEQLSRHLPTAGLLVGLICAGTAPVLAQKAPDFSTNNTGWVSVGGEWTPLPGSPPPVKQDPGHRYVPNNVREQPTFRIADTDNPNLTQFAKDQLKRTNEAVLAGKPMWSRSARCWATGPAFLLTPAQPMFFVQTPQQVTILAQHDNDVRRIYLNVAHSANPKPSWYGESVGRYEGDALVIDTIGFNDKTYVDNFRTPHSEKLHLIERLRLVEDGKFIEAEVTIEDPAIFLQPLHVTKRARRVEATLAEWRCAAGEMNNAFSNGADPLPIAAKADF
jgi:hypothetical protein